MISFQSLNEHLGKVFMREGRLHRVTALHQDLTGQFYVAVSHIEDYESFELIPVEQWSRDLPAGMPT